MHICLVAGIYTLILIFYYNIMEENNGIDVNVEHFNSLTNNTKIQNELVEGITIEEIPKYTVKMEARRLSLANQEDYSDGELDELRGLWKLLNAHNQKTWATDNIKNEYDDVFEYNAKIAYKRANSLIPNMEEYLNKFKKA